MPNRPLHTKGTNDPVVVVRQSRPDREADDFNKVIEFEKLSVVGKLAENVSSEIGNILASLYIEERESEDAREYVSRLQTLRQRLMGYIPPRALAQEQIGFNDLIEDCIGLLSAQIQVSGVRISLKLDPDLPILIGDRSQLERAMIVLLVNGLQALPSSNGLLRISTRLRPGYCMIRIRDFGKGIDHATAERLFEPFFSTRTDGFGLGLYACRRIIRAHGWELRARTGLKRGTSLEVTVPLVESR